MSVDDEIIKHVNVETMAKLYVASGLDVDRPPTDKASAKLAEEIDKLNKLVDDNVPEEDRWFVKHFTRVVL